MINPQKLIAILQKKKTLTVYSSWNTGRNKGLSEAIEIIKKMDSENDDRATRFPSEDFPGFQIRA